VVSIEGADGTQQTTITETDGTFKLVSLALENYNVKISASGMSDWTGSNIPALLNPEPTALQVVLQVAPQVTSVTVGLPPDEVTTEQLNQELKQRALGGMIPNYYVTYESHPAPLSSTQKLHLAYRLLLDPSTFAVVGITAGIQQAKNSYWQWGQGAEAFSKRFAAGYATAAQNLLITSVFADSILHQDPRYFYSGQGSKARRAWYAVESAFRAKGDNGKWQPPYASLIGSVASAEIAQAYYPGSRTQYSLLGRTLMFRFAGAVALNLAEEFFLKKVTRNAPESAADLPVLREGTPVSLIAVDDLGAETRTEGQTITFVLAEDLEVRGKVLARAGDVASGQVEHISAVAGQAQSVELERVKLIAGDVNVPLRCSQSRGADRPMQYKELPESGKVEVTLFVAEDVRFPEAQ